MINVEILKLNIADMWLIPLDRVTYIGPIIDWNWWSECAPWRVKGAYPAADLAQRPVSEAAHDEEAKGNPIGWKFWYN